MRVQTAEKAQNKEGTAEPLICRLESDPTVGDGDAITVEPTTVFQDNAEVQTTDDAMGFVSGLTENDETQDIAQFLSRPLVVDNATWPHGSHFSYDLDVWGAFLTDAAVVKKLANYHRIRATINVRVMINGMPFHQGRIFWGYSPLRNKTGVSDGDARLTMISNLPGFTMLNPALNNVVERAYPYFHYLNYHNIGGATNDIGYIVCQSSDPLTTSNGQIVDANVVTYAWLTDVSLSIPTSQGRKRKKGTAAKLIKAAKAVNASMEEENSGPISGMASSMASALGYFEHIPILGPYAEGASTILGTAANIASVFGFSKPVNLTNEERFRGLALGNMSLGTGSDPAQKLSMDPRQGIDIDASDYGPQLADELLIDVIKRKWSYAGELTWNPTDIPGHKVGHIIVTPRAHTTGTNLYTAPSNTEFIAPLFTGWSGGMEYMIVLLSSKFSSGRLRVYYEPTINTTSLSTNTTSSVIIDLSNTEQQQVGCCFKVGWGQTEPYRPLNPSPVKTVGDGILVPVSFHNGTIFIEVLTKLVSPDVTNTIQLLVFQRGAEDLEYVGPNFQCGRNYSDTDNSNTIVFQSQSDISGNIGREFDKAGCDITLIRENVNYSEKPLKYYGERIVSLRQYIKRYSFWRADSILRDGTGTLELYSRVVATGLPIEGGNGGALGYGMAAGPTPYNYTNLTPMTYVAHGFAGWKGGIRYKFIFDESITTQRCNMVTVRRTYNTDYTVVADFRPTVTAVPVDSNVTDEYAAAFANLSVGASAGLAVTGDTMNTLEVEIPYYSRYNFSDPPIDLRFNQTLSDGGQTTVILDVTSLKSGSSVTGAQQFLYQIYAAAADDFTCIWYTGGDLRYDEGNFAYATPL